VAIKVTFSNRDEILGAVVRALAVQAAGFQVVSGMNAEYLRQNGSYRFEFSQDQLERFQIFVRDYVPDKLRQLIEITPD